MPDTLVYIYVVYLYVERKRNVMADELKPRIVVKVIDISLRASKQVVGTDHLIASRQKPVDKMRSEKASTTCHQNTLSGIVATHD